MVEYAAQQFEPQQKVLQDFGGGVSFERPSIALQDNQLTDVQNLQYFQNRLRVDTGYSKYRQTVQGTPQSQFQFIQTNGALQVLLLTTQFLYLDNGVAWLFVGDGAFNGMLAAPAIAGANTFQLSNVAGLHVGDPVGITLSDTTQLQTTITAITGNQITTAGSIPLGLSAATSAQVTRPRSFNGSPSFQPTGLTWPNTNTFYFTNGVDPIQQFDGSSVSPASGWVGITARVLITFHGFLIAMDTTEAAGRFPQRTRWSDINNPNVTVGGLAGFVDLTDTEDFILAAVPLGPWLIIYREASIMRRSYIGDPLQLFFDEYMVTGIGLFSQNSIADTGATHVFAGPDGIFRYSGGYDIEDIGGPIFDRLLGPQGIFNNSQGFLANCFYVSELDEVWLMVPTGSNTWLDTLFRLDQETGGWWIRQFPNDKFVGFGFLESIAGRTWQQATLPWNTDTTTWLSHSKQAQAPLTLFLAQGGFTRLYDYSTTNDNGGVISWLFASKDFASPAKKLRVDGIYAKAIGNNILVEMSFDEGNTWIRYGVFNFGLTFTTQQINGQYAGVDVCRFRLSGTDPLFQLDWIRLDYYEETYW